jgi:protoporphyrinogen oxidase
MKYNYIILGAGPTSLGVCEFFHENKINDYIVFEKNEYAGGYATTLTDTNGFRWDYGGHILYSKNEFFIKKIELNNTEFIFHERSAHIYHNNNFIDYPFQKHINQLNENEYKYCLDELLKVTENDITTEQTLLSWSNNTFGKGIVDLFFKPYNEKVWGYSLDKLSNNWISKFVAKVNINDIYNSDKSWGMNAIFRYPKYGIGQIWKDMAVKYNIKYNSEIIKIDIINKIIYTKLHKYTYNKLITTISLKDLINISNCSDDIKKTANQLLYSHTHIIGIGIKGNLPECLNNKHWIYFSSYDIPFYRLSILSNYSSEMTPPNCYSLLCEVCETNEKIVSDNIVQEVIDSLLKLNFISNSNDIISQFYQNVYYGYPTVMYNRDKYLKKNKLLFRKS